MESYWDFEEVGDSSSPVEQCFVWQSPKWRFCRAGKIGRLLVTAIHQASAFHVGTCAQTGHNLASELHKIHSSCAKP